jgi:transporter family protein
VFAEGAAGQLRGWSRHTWTCIVLSALATGLSWLFYYKALQLGDASRVAPVDKLSVALTIVLAFIFLSEKPSLGNVLGGALVVAGILVTIYLK